MPTALWRSGRWSAWLPQVPPWPSSSSAEAVVRVQRPTLAIDFDGVLYNNAAGWQGGATTGAPMPGAVEAVRKLSMRYRLVVFTARYDLAPVCAWLQANGMAHYFVDVTNRKPGAVVYLDDRAMHFNNWDQAYTELSRRAA